MHDMTYQVLARKWRPQVFDSVVGQNHIVTIIQNSCVLNKVHHAYIFFGTRGVGKTTLARLFAKVLHCPIGTKFSPCGNCSICLEIEKGCFLDVIEIDAASRTKIEDTREFLDDVYYSPNIGEVKIYLIDEVHMLSRNSLNALLKILEEPPRHVKFFLITTDQKKLPPTILSRCVQFYLRPLSESQIFDQLVHIFTAEKVDADPSAIKLISYFAYGSMRDALSLSEQAIMLGNNKISCDIVREMLGIIDIEHALSLLEDLVVFKMNAVMFRINQYAKFNINWDYLLSDMLFLLQKIAVIQCSSKFENNLNDDKATCKDSRLNILSKQIASEDIQLYYQIFLLGRKELIYAPNYRMGFEMIMMRAAILFNSEKNTNDYCASKENNSKISYITNMIVNQGAFVSSFSIEKIRDK